MLVMTITVHNEVRVKQSDFSSLLCVQTLEQEEKDNEAVSKMMALDQKNQLLNLFHEKNRPTLAKWPQVDQKSASKLRSSHPSGVKIH